MSELPVCIYQMLRCDPMDIREHNRKAWNRLVAGQMEAGFVLTGFMESSDTRPEREPIADYMPLFFMTRAVKPA